MMAKESLVLFNSSNPVTYRSATTLNDACRRRVDRFCKQNKTTKQIKKKTRGGGRYRDLDDEPGAVSSLSATSHDDRLLVVVAAAGDMPRETFLSSILFIN